ncbi:MAG: Hsp20/alpha crystallin family protein [bacterium]|nr:Hsp20/alpha crystallin family protein [bacterium]
MRASRLEMMHDHVRAIHRAVTGGDPPETSPPRELGEPPTLESLMRRFAELEALARTTPPIAERVPPFSFAPPLDLISSERELIVEVGVPGITVDDVEVELSGETLIISGARPTRVALNGRIYLHAELPRGPFRRELQLPPSTSGRPRVEVENGILRVRLARAGKSSLPQA